LGGEKIHIGYPHGQNIFIICIPFEAVAGSAVNDLIKIVDGFVWEVHLVL
jgi:hypothetical protein